MELTEVHGMRFALADIDEAVRTEWSPYRDRVDVVRVENPASDRWPELRAAGFVPKPMWVMWVADPLGSEDEYLAGLATQERSNIRRAKRKLDANGLKVSIRDIDPALYDVFLRLYEDRIAEMRHGWAVATEQREVILSDAGNHFAVCVHQDAELVGCCVARLDKDKDMVRIRFSAVDVPGREASLARAFFMAVIQVAREIGHGSVSLGSDPNLYGHIAKPGLLGFKSRLGFGAHPSHHLDPLIGNDQADLPLGLSRLGDPAIVLGYADEVPTDRLRLEAFSEVGDIDLREYRAKFLHGEHTHVLPSPAPSCVSGSP
jgi:hypothetical protein